MIWTIWYGQYLSQQTHLWLVHFNDADWTIVNTDDEITISNLSLNLHDVTNSKFVFKIFVVILPIISDTSIDTWWHTVTLWLCVTWVRFNWNFVLLASWKLSATFTIRLSSDKLRFWIRIATRYLISTRLISTKLSQLIFSATYGAILPYSSDFWNLFEMVKHCNLPWIINDSLRQMKYTLESGLCRFWRFQLEMVLYRLKIT